MSIALPPSVDVIVVGAGNAAFCAALAAAESGVSVLMLERAPEEEAGGNSRFTAGAFRCVYDGVEDLRALMPDLTDEEVSKSDFGTYTEEKFFDDMGRITEYRTDPDLCEILVTRSKATMLWMREKGMRFMPIWGRQAYKINGILGRADGRGLGRWARPGRKLDQDRRQEQSRDRLRRAGAVAAFR
jgi:tricarballylate dehydrogenase